MPNPFVNNIKSDTTGERMTKEYEDEMSRLREERLKTELVNALQGLSQQRREQDQFNTEYQQQTPPQTPIQQPVPQRPQQPGFMTPFQAHPQLFEQAASKPRGPNDVHDPRIALGLYGKTLGESDAVYNLRLQNGYKSLGYQFKDEFHCTEDDLDRTRYRAEEGYLKAQWELKKKRQQYHKRWIDPSHILYDPVYVEQWNAKRAARHAINEPIMAQLLAEVRQWQASTGREREPTPDPDASGDELYPPEMPKKPRPDQRYAKDGKKQDKFKCWECKKARRRCTYLEFGTRPCNYCKSRDYECVEVEWGVPDPRYIRDRLEERGKLPHEITDKRSKSPGRLNFPTTEPLRRRSYKGEDLDEQGNGRHIFSSGQKRPRSASPIREKVDRFRKCVSLGLTCNTERPCRFCRAISSRGTMCDLTVPNQDGENTKVDEFSFAQTPPESLDTTPAPHTATPDTSLAYGPTEERIQYLRNLTDAVANYDRPDPTVSSTPPVSPYSGSAYSSAAAPSDPFQNPLFLSEESLQDIFNGSIQDNGEPPGISSPVPQQQLENAASTWGQTDQYPVPEIPYNTFDNFNVQIPYDFDFDFDPDEMMDMLKPNPVSTYSPLPETPEEMDVLSLSSVNDYSPLPESPPEGSAVQPHNDQFLPEAGAYGASWETPGRFNTLPHVDVLSGYPDNPVRRIVDHLEQKTCSELRDAFIPQSNEMTKCSLEPALRCEFLPTAAHEFDWRPENHSVGEPHYTCVYCRHDQNQEAGGWEAETKAAIKAFVCAGCASELASQQKTRLATCVCLDKLMRNWLCHYHRRRGFQQVVLRSGVVGAWLVQVGSGIQMCPRCYRNPGDRSSKVYACKACRTYVEEA